jgi:hypothetical protein
MLSPDSPMLHVHLDIEYVKGKSKGRVYSVHSLPIYITCVNRSPSTYLVENVIVIWVSISGLTFWKFRDEGLSIEIHGSVDAHKFRLHRRESGVRRSGRDWGSR